jgi:hypothetical protein
VKIVSTKTLQAHWQTNEYLRLSWRLEGAGQNRMGPSTRTAPWMPSQGICPTSATLEAPDREIVGILPRPCISGPHGDELIRTEPSPTSSLARRTPKRPSEPSRRRCRPYPRYPSDHGTSTSRRAPCTPRRSALCAHCAFKAQLTSALAISPSTCCPKDQLRQSARTRRLWHDTSL